MLTILIIAPALGQQTTGDWVNKGTALFSQGKYNEAIQAYDKAIELNPNLVLAWYNKGNAFKALGRISEADAAFAKAKELGYNG
jgi:tetratricopeptide (TPR) repeat protein